MATTQKQSPTRYAVCPRDGAPLVSTFAFNGAEFYCLDCGGSYGMFSTPSRDATEELHARYDDLEAEWLENAGRKLLTPGAWHRDCPKCELGGEPHMSHATDEERVAHAAALKWLEERRV